MSLELLSNVLGKRGITHSYCRADRNFAKIYELFNGRSAPVILVNLVDGSFLEMPHYSRLKSKSKILIAEAETEYQRRFKRWYKKSH